jgi:HTH-type transcriptional regulator, sugar sensing transcriptional regulator
MTADDVVGQLVRLGFTTYQARVYSSLVALGVGSVSEIYRRSKVPRTKVYESLDDLVRRGAVELQAGRPALYRAVRPKSLVARLVEDYTDSAKEVSRTLEEDFQEARSAEHDLAWTVKGDQAIRRKLVGLITSAKRELLTFETYPATFTLSVVKLLRAVARRGVDVRAISLLGEGQSFVGLPENDFLEYRRFPTEPRRSRPAVRPDQDFLGPLAVTLASPYGLIVVDGTEALVIIPHPGDELGSVGLSAKIPGVPMLLSVMFRQFIVERTKKARS